MLTTDNKLILDSAVEELEHATNTENESGKFNFVYPMTTENISGYSKLVHNFSSTLCVMGSGDHVLNAIANGALKVDCFDVNPITYYLLALKIAALNMPYGAYVRFFTVDKSWDEFSDSFFSERKYREIRHYMEDDAIEFWDTFYVTIRNSGKTPQTCNMFRHMRYSRDTITNANDYLKPETYKSMASKVNRTPIKFYHCSLMGIMDLLPKENLYNVIMLSNISDYINNMWPKCTERLLLRNYNDFTDKLAESRLALGGQLLFAYIYEAGTGPGWTPIDNLEWCVSEFPRAHMRFIPAMCREYKNAPSTVDAILIKDRRFSC